MRVRILMIAHSRCCSLITLEGVKDVKEKFVGGGGFRLVPNVRKRRMVIILKLTASCTTAGGNTKFIVGVQS